MRPGLGLFAKPPEPGRVKTRLVPPLTENEAAALYAAFLADIATTLDVGEAWDWVVFSTDPQQQEAAWPKNAPRPAAWYPQRGADLGARMDDALSRLLGEGRPSAILVGSDHPTLEVGTLVSAVLALERTETVFGPSTDGGYYLVGIDRPQPDLFHDIPWSTSKVFSRTLTRVADLGLGMECLQPWYDVDRPEDLGFLQAHLTALALSGKTDRAARTRAAMEGLSSLKDPRKQL